MTLHTVALIALTGGVLYIAARQAPAPAAAVTPPPPPAMAYRAPGVPYVGVAEADQPHSMAGTRAFARRTGVHPGLVAYYEGWGSQFDAPAATRIHAFGGMPLLNLDTDTVSLSAIVAGRWDAYLRTYAHAVTRWRFPIAIAIDHEMNGGWYPWGYTHTRPATFVAAWRHIHQIFAAEGARNVVWTWITAQIGHGPLTALYPGDAYVDWVGLNGYYIGSITSFAPLGQFVTKLRHVAPGKPVLLTETSVQPGPHQAAGITSLFIGAARYGLAGVIWFDFDRKSRRDWRLDRPAAITAFTKAARRYLM